MELIMASNEKIRPKRCAFVVNTKDLTDKNRYCGQVVKNQGHHFCDEHEGIRTPEENRHFYFSKDKENGNVQDKQSGHINED
jgi:hypothetical protein